MGGEGLVCVCVLAERICVVRGNLGCYPDGGVQVSSGGEYRFCKLFEGGGGSFFLCCRRTPCTP